MMLLIMAMVVGMVVRMATVRNDQTWRVYIYHQVVGEMGMMALDFEIMMLLMIVMVTLEFILHIPTARLSNMIMIVIVILM